MKKPNTLLIIATILLILAFFAHTFGGDLELQLIKPETDKQPELQIWTMMRCGWHWISFDLLFAAIGLILVNFTNYFESPGTILKCLRIYFFGYAVVWLGVVLISDPFPYNTLKLGQWILLLTIFALIHFANRKMHIHAKA